MIVKKILFLTGTRADFGKIKSLINKVNNSKKLESHIFVTGMHMQAKYGMTVEEVEKSGFGSIYKYINQNSADSMDIVLSKTIHGLSDYVKELKPDMIVVHGDRVEAMAGAIVGALNNILVSHIEGGEVSGTIDELIRHSITKMAHLHFVCNEIAHKRLVQLGECEQNIFTIGSPDLDIMTSKNLPTLEVVKNHYEIDFDQFGVFMYHPVTTDLESLPINIKNSIDALIESNLNYVVIYPNNDHGSELIIKELDRLRHNPRFRIFPSIRFEFFLTLIKNSMFMIGNSSAGVREMPFYGIPSINIGTRQYNRAKSKTIFNSREDKKSILKLIEIAKVSSFEPVMEFGTGKSDQLFLDVVEDNNVWKFDKQKIFIDLRLI